LAVVSTLEFSQGSRVGENQGMAPWIVVIGTTHGMRRRPKRTLGGEIRMPHERKVRRREIEARVELAEKILCEARSSAARGGHSRAIVLQLERKIHAIKKDLALLDLQPEKSGNIDPDTKS
jgi:hypothetical protein